jgi:UDP-N-acetylglucosamine 3-dehydrogenase
MFELDYLTQKLVFTRHPDVEHPNLIHGFAPTFAVHAIEVAVDQVEPLAAELDAFLTAVRTGGAPMVSGEDGLWALAMAEALLRSAAETRPVDVVDPIARPVAT